MSEDSIRVSPGRPVGGAHHAWQYVTILGAAFSVSRGLAHGDR